MQTRDHPHNNFDFVRVFAALCVIYSHQHALTGLPEPSVLGVHSVGGFGVLLFFSISGYLVCASWRADPNVPRFILRRFLRIWPALTVAVVLTVFVLGPAMTRLPLPDYFSHPRVADHLNNLRFVFRDQLASSVIVENPFRPNINGPLWTIPIEVKCYALLGLLGVGGLLKRRWLVTTLVLTIVFPYAVMEARGETIASALGWKHEQLISLEFLLFFLTGAMIQHYNISSGSHGRRWAWALCGIGAGLAFALQRPVLSLWLVIPITTILIGAASTPYLRRTGRFGDFSYGLYLYAMPIQQIFIWLFKDRMSWSMLFMLALLSTLCLAVASWHLVEKEALRLKPDNSRNIDLTVVTTVGLLGYILLV